jgi:hypothetical protein
VVECVAVKTFVGVETYLRAFEFAVLGGRGGSAPQSHWFAHGEIAPREKRHLLPVLGIDLRSFSSEARGICCAYTGLADRVFF